MLLFSYGRRRKESRLTTLTYLATASCSVAGASLGATVAWFSEIAVGADTSLSVEAPEQTVVRARHGGIGLGKDKLTFPAQRRAEIRIVGIESIGLADHATPPDAAFRTARFTATRASCTL